MKISSSFNKTDNSKCYQSFKGIPPKQKFYPEFIGNIGKVAGEYINTPEQKLFLATTALMFQPLIDLKFARDEQKEDAAIKSASKAMAGGITGVIVRASFMKIAEHFIGVDKPKNFINYHFLPEKAEKLFSKDPDIVRLNVKKYCNTLGNFSAIVFMLLFSNSKVDVPLTSDFQDLITGVVKEDKSWIKSFNDVFNSRCKKISNWFKKKKGTIDNINKKTKKIIKIITEESPDKEKNKIKNKPSSQLKNEENK